MERNKKIENDVIKMIICNNVLRYKETSIKKGVDMRVAIVQEI